jgi:hypothetical protein
VAAGTVRPVWTCERGGAARRPAVRGTLASAEEAGVFEQVEEQHLTPVAVVTDAQAELLVVTLRVHGIDATSPSVSAFPSLDWAEGRAICVRLDQVAAAAELLRGFGHRILPGVG